MGDLGVNRPHRGFRGVGGSIVGALVGFTLSSLVYVLVNPTLERSGGLLRETQGLLWSCVPVLTALGALVGHRISRRR